jgi:hypothetical protein
MARTNSNTITAVGLLLLKKRWGSVTGLGC